MGTSNQSNKNMHDEDDADLVQRIQVQILFVN